jgi:SAM-dependent methyltransferase
MYNPRARSREASESRFVGRELALHLSVAPIAGAAHRIQDGVGIYQRSQRHARAWRAFGQAAMWMLGLVLAASGLLSAQRARAQVPFVPTPLDVVERMLALAKVDKGDYLIDLGSGDGRVVREAARRFGARGLGVDHDKELIERSVELARRDGVAGRVTFAAQDLFEIDIGDATVVTMYLLPAVNLKLRPRLLRELRPGTRVVSHDFDMGEWQPDETASLYSKEKYGATGGNSTIYLWVVPAQVAGRWQWEVQVRDQLVNFDMGITQSFQRAQATVRAAGQQVAAEEIVLRGDRLSFVVTLPYKGSPLRYRFSGKVAEDAIEGNVTLSGSRLHGAAEWNARRIERSAGHIALPTRAGLAVPTR